MSTDKTYPLLETDSAKMPNFDQPNLEVIGVAGDLPLLSIKNRKFMESEEFMTVAGLEETIQKIDDKIASLQIFKERYVQMLKYAKENSEIALDNKEADDYKHAIQTAERLKGLEKKEGDSTPEEELQKKKLKEALHLLMEGFREPIRIRAEKAIEKINNPENAES